MTVTATVSASVSPNLAPPSASFDAALDRAIAARETGTTSGPAPGDSIIDPVAGPDDGKTFGWGGSHLGQGRLECPSSIDLNGDGRIGLDELLAAMGLTGTHATE
jgi:hypothetical protein